MDFKTSMDYIVLILQIRFLRNIRNFTTWDGVFSVIYLKLSAKYMVTAYDRDSMKLTIGLRVTLTL